MREIREHVKACLDQISVKLKEIEADKDGGIPERDLENTYTLIAEDFGCEVLDLTIEETVPVTMVLMKRNEKHSIKVKDDFNDLARRIRASVTNARNFKEEISRVSATGHRLVKLASNPDILQLTISFDYELNFSR